MKLQTLYTHANLTDELLKQNETLIEVINIHISTFHDSVSKQIDLISIEIDSVTN